MKKIFNTDSFSHQGQRDNNEDSLFPNDEITTNLNNLYLVCDGVGGHDKGEIASDLCCTQLNTYFTNNKIENSDENTIDDAIRFLELKFDSYMKDNPESINMASTITLLHLHSKGATVAHMGDSRVYQFREGEIIFRTKDHSLVQELFDAGILLTEEEMQNHSRKNQISRAMRGASIKSYKADTTIITDLQVGDVFFMCSDGVLESFTDEDLQKVFANPKNLETIGAILVGKCAKNSRDNYTGYMIQITQEYIDTLELTKVEDSEKTSAMHTKPDNTSATTIIQSRQSETEAHDSKTTQINNKEEKTEVRERTQKVKDDNLSVPKSEKKNRQATSKTSDTLPWGRRQTKNVSIDALKEEVKNAKGEEGKKSKRPPKPPKKNKQRIFLYGLIVILLLSFAYFFVFTKECKTKVKSTIEKTISKYPKK